MRVNSYQFQGRFNSKQEKLQDIKQCYIQSHKNMYLTRNKTLHWLLRQSRDLYKKPPSRAEDSSKQERSHESVHASPLDAAASKTSETNKPSLKPDTFPYKFGGIKHYPVDHSALDILLPKQRPFFELYIALLHAIANRDVKKIEKIVEPSLLQPLTTAPDCSFIDANTSGKILYHQFSLGIGTTFVRAKGPFRKQATPDNLVTMYSPQSFSPTSYLFSSEGIPVLLSVNATIISKARLGEKGVSESASEEAHSVTFECESKLLMKKMMDLMGMLPSMGSQPDKDLLKRLFYESNPQWRIGNLDKFLRERYQ